MRELASLSNESQARLFAAYLFVQEIPATVDDDDGEWVIWIHNDDDRDRAAEFLKEYLEDPAHPRYENAERKVRHVLKEVARLQNENRKKEASLKKRWEGTWWHCYPATYVMIGICILIAVACTDISKMLAGRSMVPALCNNKDSAFLEKLWFLDQQIRADNEQLFLRRCRDWEEEELGEEIEGNVVNPENVPYLKRTELRIRSSADSFIPQLKTLELWRLITPAFIHLNLLHILFNMMCLRMLGSAVEYVRGTRRFIWLCVLLAISSNLVQYFWSGPDFGGFSGVIFGLFGYVWMKGETQPEHGLALRQQAVMYCFLWQALCISGIIPNVANAAHMGGFIAGIVIGARHSIWRKLPFTS